MRWRGFGLTGVITAQDRLHLGQRQAVIIGDFFGRLAKLLALDNRARGNALWADRGSPWSL